MLYVWHTTQLNTSTTSMGRDDGPKSTDPPRVPVGLLEQESTSRPAPIAGEVPSALILINAE